MLLNFPTIFVAVPSNDRESFNVFEKLLFDNPKLVPIKTWTPPMVTPEVNSGSSRQACQLVWVPLNMTTQTLPTGAVVGGELKGRGGKTLYVVQHRNITTGEIWPGYYIDNIDQNAARIITEPGVTNCLSPEDGVEILASYHP